MGTVKMRNITEPVAVGKIICVGANYALHNREMGRKSDGRPVLFFKPPSALVTEGYQIIYPSFSNDVHHELEMVLLIGKAGKNVSPENAIDLIAGYGLGLDLTARDIQQDAKKKGSPWAIAKGFDCSAPVTEFLPLTPDIDLDSMEMKLKINGKLRQHGNTSDMILSTRQIISYISEFFTLLPGDLVFTGTPEGVGPIRRGDQLEIDLAGKVSAIFDVI